MPGDLRPIRISVAALVVSLVFAFPFRAFGDSFNYRNFTGEINWFQTHFKALDMADRAPLTGQPQFLRLMWNNGYGADPYILDRGAIWYTPRQTVVNGFTTEFKFRITPPDPSALPPQSWAVGDGFAFVLQDHDLLTIGDGSWHQGYGRIQRGIAIEFDIHNDDWTPDPDPDANHVSIITPVDVNLGDTDPAGLYPYAPLATAPVRATLADGRPHVATIVYTAARRRWPATMTVLVDRKLVLTAIVPDLTTYFASGQAIIGFTAGRSIERVSGGNGVPLRTADVDILSWAFLSLNR